MLADKAVIGFCLMGCPRHLEKRKQMSVQIMIGMNFAFSMSAVKQADAKPMQRPS